LPTSTSPFDFHPLVGPEALKEDQLFPGDTVTVDQFGNVTGTFLDPLRQVCKNKIWSSNPKPFTVVAVGIVTIYTSPGGPGTTYNPGQTVTIPQNSNVAIVGDFKVLENTVTTLSSTSLVMNSSLWFDPNQANYQILYGSVDSMDDTANFSTIWDSYVSTGCVPEPSTLLMLGSGILGLGGFLRKRLLT